MQAQEKSVLEVTPAEAGQKLMQFLQRRLSLPSTLLHRWVRTGQIRRNGGRCKPFDHVVCGDMVRLPPFALSMSQSGAHGTETHGSTAAHGQQREAAAGDTNAHQGRGSLSHDSATAAPTATSLGQDHMPSRPSAARTEPQPCTGEGRRGISPVRPQGHGTPTPAAPPALPLPPLVYADDLLLVFNKPAGLPAHPGTGHSDALTTRLARHYAHLPFLPTPAHRLDKDTSGLLLVASAYSSLRALQDAFRHRHMVKEYVAWVEGLWPHDFPMELRHRLAKEYVGSNEKMRVRAAVTPTSSVDIVQPTALSRPGLDTGLAPSLTPGLAPSLTPGLAPAPGNDAGKEAVCVVHCLRRDPEARSPQGTGRSLMHIRLITGRTHQIRAQLAAVGHGLCGDFKYGSPDAPPTRHGKYAKGSPRPLYLHSLRIRLPEVPELAHIPREFTVLPPWQGRMALQELPLPLTVLAP